VPVKIKFLIKSSGDVIHPCMYSMLRQSETLNKIYPLASEVTSETESLLFTSLYAQKFLKFIRKVNRTSDLPTLELALTQVGSMDAFDFYQKATFQSQDFINIVLKAVRRRFRGVVLAGS
jgi:hypothetical protein